MPHFSDDPDGEDPAFLRKLRAMLRASGTPPRRPPTREERFGVRPDDGAGTAGRRTRLVRAGTRPGSR